MTMPADMELSRLIAQILAVIYLSAAIGGLLNRDFYRSIAEDIYKNRLVTFLMGFLGIIFGMLLIHFHNIWVRDWPVLITIVGWIALLKGINLIAFPQLFRKIAAPFLSETGIRIYPYATLLIGLLFAWLGFFKGQ